MSIPQKLRQLADDMEKAAQGPPPLDLSLKESVVQLAQYAKTGRLEILISWDQWGTTGYEIGYKLFKDYRIIDESESLAALLQSVAAKQTLPDTLDRLAEKAVMK